MKGDRDPTAVESRRIVGSLSGMMTDCEPLYDAISNYTDTCVAKVVKGGIFAGGGLLLAGAMLLVPPVGPLVAVAALGGSLVGGGMLGGFTVVTIVDGIDLHNSRQRKQILCQYCSLFPY
jgi:hypothetical protein